MKKKLLIVDDDLDMLNLYQAVLSEVFETIPATNGKEAVELAVAEVPDCNHLDFKGFLFLDSCKTCYFR